MTRLLTAVPLVGFAVCASLAQTALAVPQAPPPPELAPLLQKTSELQLNSERFSAEVTITARKLPRKLKALGGLKSKITGELSVSPEVASLTETVLGKTLSLRLIDKTLYIEDPTISKHDGGRPWIVQSQSPSSGVFGAHPTLPGSSGGSSGSGASGGPAVPLRFRTDVALLEASNDVRSLGASTIDGQAVTGFAGAADPREIEQSSLPKELRESVAKSHVKPAATFEVFLAANGLPVRSHIVLALGSVKLNTTGDVLASDFPVVAPTPPPASETISAAALVKLEKTRLKHLPKRQRGRR